MIKGIERVTPMLKFNLRGVEVKLHGVRQAETDKLLGATILALEAVDNIQTVAMALRAGLTTVQG